MAKVIRITMAGLLLGALASLPLQAATVDTATVDVTATVTGVSTLTTQPKNIDTDTDDTNDTDATNIAFGSIGAGTGVWGNLPGQYVRINVDDNAPSWRLSAYSNNFGGAVPDPADWPGTQFGGMISQGGILGQRAPMAWMSLPNTVANGPGTGLPSDPTQGWTFMKDLADQDDPATATNDESFAASDAAGFTNVAFGAASFTNIVRPNLDDPATPQSEGSETLAGRTDPFYWYVEADFSGSSAADYGTTINLDLINN
jgi:hypothetical protein